MKKVIILIHCKDKKAIIATITNYIASIGGNIVYLDQHVDADQNVFFMRLECDFENNYFSMKTIQQDFESKFQDKFQMSWELFEKEQNPKMAIFVSKYDHCLYDLLSRYSSKELKVSIPVIISNHNELEKVAHQFDIPFYHIPFSKDNKLEAEQKQLEILQSYSIDFIVLARYMQIVTANLINKYQNKIINIHHSFLPAFPGAKPYHSAFNRGVKIIGATSHYVTEQLDEGPIIEQDITRVSHIHSIDDFIMKGRDLERIVLARAIKLHSERKTMVYNNKTVVFS